MIGRKATIRTWPFRAILATCAAVAVSPVSRAGGMQFVRTWFDDPCDAMPRPTDAGANAPFDPARAARVELLEISLGRWEPFTPQANLFSGNYAPQGRFLRLDVLLDGLVHPPGPSDPLGFFDPFRYGPRPVFGFIEIDMDANPNTGGELDAPQFRYLSNVARFGGRPADPDLADRVALDGSDMDDDFMTAPYVERHGEEFHLALLGGQFIDADIQVTAGNTDLHFEPGETWTIEGAWFHRAHGYEPYSLAEGGAFLGEYAPPSKLRFQHQADTDRTQITLVFPFTNVGAALMRGESPQPNNGDPSDQFSIYEALFDLQESAQFLREYPSGEPEEVLITAWANANPAVFLDPVAWKLTAVLGTSYTLPSGDEVAFVWTDVHPDPVWGDVNGDGSAGAADRSAIEQFIAANDGADGEMDGRVMIPGFASAFLHLDLNYDGYVDALDVARAALPGDTDLDGDVDLADWAVFQRCAGTTPEDPDWASCHVADLDTDREVGLDDACRWAASLSGPVLE